MSKEYMVLSFTKSGTLFSTISLAMPSAIAVLPTPDSPTNSGLFLFLLARICITLSTSAFLPIRGSIFPSIASWFRFKVKASSAELSLAF